MDKVVQQNASQAEESASASEEMNAQSEQLEEIIRQLADLARGGNRSNGGRADAGPVHRLRKRRRRIGEDPGKGKHGLAAGGDLMSDREFRNL